MPYTRPPNTCIVTNFGMGYDAMEVPITHSDQHQQRKETEMGLFIDPMVTPREDCCESCHLILGACWCSTASTKAAEMATQLHSK